MTLQIGQMLYGYCGGYLGRRAYLDGPFRIEAVGIDWVVVRDAKGVPGYAGGKIALEYLQTDECTKPKPDENF